MIGQRSGSVNRGWFKAIKTGFLGSCSSTGSNRRANWFSRNRPIARHWSLKKTAIPPSRRRQGPRPKSRTGTEIKFNSATKIYVGLHDATYQGYYMHRRSAICDCTAVWVDALFLAARCTAPSNGVTTPAARVPNLVMNVQESARARASLNWFGSAIPGSATPGSPSFCAYDPI